MHLAASTTTPNQLTHPPNRPPTRPPGHAVENGEFEADEVEDDGEGGPLLSPGAATLWLFGITVLVAACSEALTGSIEEVSHTWGLSQGFLGFIVLPIAGNACEHVTAVFVAMKNKMDLRWGGGGGLVWLPGLGGRWVGLGWVGGGLKGGRTCIHRY